MDNLAIVLPVYNESQSIYDNFKVIHQVLQLEGIKARYLLVDDGSKDDTWLYLDKLASEYDEVQAIGFARNFGKEIALSAGVAAIDADYYLIMDSDLQHPPRFVKEMINLMESEGADIVEGIKADRGRESFKSRFLAKNFYRFLKRISNLEMDNSSDFKLMTREVVDSIRSFDERHVFFRGIVDWVGYKKVQLPIVIDDRQLGETHFSTFKLIKLAMDAVFSYTSKPLYITIVLGVIFMAFAGILGIQTLYNFIVGYAVDGFTTVIILVLITGSAIMMSLGLIGIYISRIYDEVKQRPKYIIKNRTHKNGDADGE